MVLARASQRGQPVARWGQTRRIQHQSPVVFSSGAQRSSAMQRENRSNRTHHTVVHFGLCHRRAMSTQHVMKHGHVVQTSADVLFLKHGTSRMSTSSEQSPCAWCDLYSFSPDVAQFRLSLHWCALSTQTPSTQALRHLGFSPLLRAHLGPALMFRRFFGSHELRRFLSVFDCILDEATFVATRFQAKKCPEFLSHRATGRYTPEMGA